MAPFSVTESCVPAARAFCMRAVRHQHYSVPRYTLVRPRTRSQEAIATRLDASVTLHFRECFAIAAPKF
eukprot:345870-Amphidinium_carterae.2